MTLAIFDYDNTIYKACFAAEKRSVVVTQKNTGKKKAFKNQTEFFGRKKNTIEGWLGKQNEIRTAKGLEPFTKDDFEIETVRTPDKIENVLHTVKSMIHTACEAVGADEYVGYIGEGDSFRLDRSTIYKYKGNRENVLRPIQKDEVIEYLVKHQNGIIVKDIEADDAVIMQAIEYGVDNSVVCGVDKDNYGNPIRFLNTNQLTDGVVDCRGFGELILVEKKTDGKVTKDVKGRGRKFFYFQVAYGDDIDNYRSNCATDQDFGVVSAYNALSEAKNDKEALEALVSIYKNLYPEPKTVVGWRGEEILVDWRYVLNEVWDLARMLRHKDDRVIATDVLNRMGVI